MIQQKTSLKNAKRKNKMNVLVFKTNIQNQRMVDCLYPIFSDFPIILDWSVDIEDCDNVLRIVTTESIAESEIIHMIKNIGIACEILPD